MNSVRNLQLRPFYQPSENLEVKRLGPGRSELSTKSGSSSRRFTENWSLAHWLTGLLAHWLTGSLAHWLTGCSQSGKLFL